MTRIDPTTLAKAREWVEKDFVTEAHFRAAAEVIAALPDEWIDARKLVQLKEDLMESVRELPGIDHASTREVMRALVDEYIEWVDEILPDPAPRTLADMTREEREACQWAQADFDDGIAERPIRVVITTTGKATADIVLPDGNVYCVHAGKLTPFPDLPRMVWPDEQATEEDMSIIPPKIDTSTGHDDDVDMAPQDAPELEEGTYGQALWEMVTKAIRGEKEYAIDAQDYDGAKRWRDVERALGAARGIDLHKEPSTQPRPEDVPAGEVWVVSYRDGRAVGMREYNEYRPWYVMWDNQDLQIEGLWLGDKDITLVSRLVPEEQA